MPRDNTTNPWGDAANQAVGAMYKYYMSQPTAADRAKMEYMQTQLQGNAIDNQMKQRLYAMGGYSGMPSSAQEFLFTKSLPQDSGRRYEDIYVTKPSWQDFGDQRALMGVNGPMASYEVGTAPRVEYDDKNNRPIGIPASPSRGGYIQQLPVSDMFSALLQQESGGNPNALSPAGAAGIAQIMPDTARDPGYGVTPLQGWDGTDPRTAPVEEQMRFGQDYLNAMINNRGGNIQEGLAAYNAGPGAVAEYNGIPPYAETQQYVENIMNNAGIQSNSSVPQGADNQGIIWPDATGGYPLNIDQTTKQTGKNNISSWIEELAGLYSQLEQNKGVISNNNGELANLATSIATTAPGSFVARGLGTESQAIRDQINGLNSMIFTALKPTLGLTGTQLDSKAEADYIKRMMGGVDIDVNATRQLLNTLNRAYGNQDSSSLLQPTDQYSQDVMETARKYGISPQEVVKRLNEAGVTDGY